MKRIIALLLAATFMLALCGCGSKKSEAVSSVENQIKGLSQITFPDKENKIANARAAYDALSAEEQGQVENFNTLTEAEFKNDIAYFEEALPDMTEKSNRIIELYDNIYNAASNSRKYAHWDGSVQDFYDYTMSVKSDTTLDSWKKKYSAFSGYWEIAFYHVASVVDGKKFSFKSCEYENDTLDCIRKDLKQLSDEDFQAIFEKAYEYGEILFSLRVFEENDVLYERFKDLNSEHKEAHEKEIAALKDWVFAVNDGVSYAAHPSGSLSEVVKGWTEISNEIKRAEQNYYLA